MSGLAGLARARELVTNVALLGTTAIGHLGEDPLLLVIQTSRRLPRPLVRSVARVLSVRRVGAAAVFGAWLAGHPDVAARLLEQRAGSPRGGWGARLLAELAVQVGRPELVPLLHADPPARVRARAAWSRGDLSDAVGWAERARGRRLVARYRSQVALLEPGRWLGGRPDAAAPVHGSRPGGGTPAVFHVLTNSLPHTHSGYTVRSQAVLAAQVEAGVRVEAATRLGYPVTVGRFTARHRDVVGPVTYRRVIRGTAPQDAVARLERQVDALLPVVRRFGPDVLHTTTHVPNGLVTAALATRLGVPWVYEVRGLLEETWVAGRGTDAERVHASASERYRWSRAREAEVASAADAVVTLSATMRDDLVERGVDGARITVVPNSVEPALLLPGPTPERARQAVGLPVDGFWVGTVSSLVDYEGLDTLIDAVAQLRARGVPARCCIVGDGVARPALERHAHVVGAADHVVFTGRVSRERAVLYHRALDAFAVPRRDTRVCRLVTPLKPIEAMACGRPVVASDLPALAEIVGRDGEPDSRGALVPPGDVVRMADVLEHWAADPALRDRLGAAGRELAAERTWTAAGRTYRALYESLGAG